MNSLKTTVCAVAMLQRIGSVNRDSPAEPWGCHDLDGFALFFTLRSSRVGSGDICHVTLLPHRLLCKEFLNQAGKTVYRAKMIATSPYTTSLSL